jgi:sterol desaturase/sphingolipid hydroxylase (fatty acid hydroxylase superfamily)
LELFQRPAATLWILPFFALAVVIEAFFYRRAKGKAYPWKESGLSLVVAIGHNIAGIVNHAVVITLLGGLAWNFRIATVPMDAWWAWPLLFILEEFAYYWYHRCAHRVRFMWSTHSVHHSPEELTLASAYRLAWTPVLSASWAFFVPIIFLGFDPVAVFGVLAVSLVYQFWLHSTLIPKLGPLELILNTPSAHRVHHASNPEYIDMNFGGVVIVFDRLFGTYKAEDARLPMRFGLTHPMISMNPLVIVYGDFVALIREVWAAKSWSDRWRLILKPPGWAPAAQ